MKIPGWIWFAALFVAILAYWAWVGFTRIERAQWCVDHGYQAANLSERVICIDDQRRMILPGE